MTNDGKQDLSRTTPHPPVQPNKLREAVKRFCRTEQAADNLVAFIEKDRLLWLKSIVPEKKRATGDLDSDYTQGVHNGYNDAIDQLMKNAEEKQ